MTDDSPPRAHHRPEAVAALDDIRRLREAMDHVSEIESELSRLGTAVSARSIELKSALKKRLSAPGMLEVRCPSRWYRPRAYHELGFPATIGNGWCHGRYAGFSPPSPAPARARRPRLLSRPVDSRAPER